MNLAVLAFLFLCSPDSTLEEINFYCLESTYLCNLPLESDTNCGKKKKQLDRFLRDIKKAESRLSWWRNFDQAGKRERCMVYTVASPRFWDPEWWRIRLVVDRACSKNLIYLQGLQKIQIALSMVRPSLVSRLAHPMAE